MATHARVVATSYCFRLALVVATSWRRLPPPPPASSAGGPATGTAGSASSGAAARQPSRHGRSASARHPHRHQFRQRRRHRDRQEVGRRRARHEAGRLRCPRGQEAAEGRDLRRRQDRRARGIDKATRARFAAPFDEENEAKQPNVRCSSCCSTTITCGAAAISRRESR